MFPSVVESPDRLIDFLTEFDSLEFHSGATRITGRLVASFSTIQPDLPRANFIETIIPLVNCGVDQLADCSLIYVGKNLPRRKSPTSVLESQHQKAQEIFFATLTTPKHLLEGFNVRPIDTNERGDSNILAMYNQLYSLFNWSEEDIIKMLANRNNLIFAAFNDQGTVVSSALAEKGIMTFERERATNIFIFSGNN